MVVALYLIRYTPPIQSLEFPVENTQVNQQPTLSGNVMFYKKPQPLSPEQHGGLGVKQIDQPFGFLREAHAVPITITEFGMGGTAYPIVFVGEDYAPIAVMGVRQNENLFVTDAGRTEEDFYLPAFVRRYPFVFANDQDGDRLLLCVDRDAPMVSNQPDVPFFNNGEATDFTTNAIEFCKEYERQRRATSEFVKVIRDLDLFEAKTVTFQPRGQDGQPNGEQQKIADYYAVDENKLNALPIEKFNELRENGALGAIYAHLISLLNWQRVINRAVTKSQDEQANNQVQV